MPRLFIALSIVVLGVGAIMGYTQLASARIAPPYTADDADVNADRVVNVGDQAIVASKVGRVVTGTSRPVTEQNLDGNGNIKVHEQGTVNVNVTSPSTLGRVIPITQDHLGALSPVFVATDDCQRIDVFLTAVDTFSTAAVYLYPSIDGATAFLKSPYFVFLPNTQNQSGQWWPFLFLNGGSASVMTNFGGAEDGQSQSNASASPFVAVEVVAAGFPEQTVSVWLYCRFAA